VTKVVAVGGGAGLSVTLTAVRRYASDITAIVSVADDGGSSGRLREALGIPAPGDLRRCLVALGDPESIWTRTFEHRFESGELQGHPLGNLVIAGLAAACGDFAAALDEAGRLVGAVGRVLPATTVPVVLRAETAIGAVRGEVAVGRIDRLTAVSLEPADAPVHRDAVAAIAAADQVVLGPGSLFTSVIAAAVAPGIRDALAETNATVIYVSNLGRQTETSEFDVDAHVLALQAHGIDPDVVLVAENALPVGSSPVPTVTSDIADLGSPTHHPERLASALSDLLGWRP
jgi:uncharacterized cofD-like protein